ncbi:hypothetical protein [Cellvibrio sp. UBA7661]|uniref:hypothetical protein n=1 Tax=Cellvibrio sp. UBA7661 TaxID=1946311 RepID=UPI002F355CEE
MSKLIYKTVFLFLMLCSGEAKCLTIENVDAFHQNDNLAVRDVDTGLVWLDFGVNNGASINSVVDSLNSVYSGWRLPTEAEVISFWDKLSVSDLTNIFDFWGANKTPADNLPYLSWGYFVDNEGYLGAAYIMEEPSALRGATTMSFSGGKIVAGIEKKIIDMKYDGSNYYLFDLDGAAEISTLLVKKIEVAEPSLLYLVLLILIIPLRKLYRLGSIHLKKSVSFSSSAEAPKTRYSY